MTLSCTASGGRVWSKPQTYAIEKARARAERARSSFSARIHIFIGAVNLKFLAVWPQVRYRNFKFKAALKIYICQSSFDSEVRIRGRPK
jgi:hypothetical protein